MNIEKQIFNHHVKLDITIGPMKDFIKVMLKTLVQQVMNAEDN